MGYAGGIVKVVARCSIVPRGVEVDSRVSVGVRCGGGLIVFISAVSISFTNPPSNEHESVSRPLGSPHGTAESSDTQIAVSSDADTFCFFICTFTGHTFRAACSSPLCAPSIRRPAASRDVLTIRPRAATSPSQRSTQGATCRLQASPTKSRSPVTHRPAIIQCHSHRALPVPGSRAITRVPNSPSPRNPPCSVRSRAHPLSAVKSNVAAFVREPTLWPERQKGRAYKESDMGPVSSIRG